MTNMPMRGMIERKCLRRRYPGPNPVIPNLFRDNTLPLLVILKHVQDDELGSYLARNRALKI